MTFSQAIVLFIAAIIGGTLNAVAGGGSFFTFSALNLLAFVPAINANATSTVSLWPGSLASARAYRDTLTTARKTLVLLGSASLLGGLLGAIVLLKTSQGTFERLLPYLLLAATVLFAFGSRITSSFRRGVAHMPGPAWVGTAGTLAIQFIIALYGGFFGGGIGILMLAVLSITGMKDIHSMNALKTILTVCINGVAVIAFIIAGAVYWPQALVMIVGAIVGGYGGAYYARKVDPRLVRGFVIVVGVGLSIYFFLHYTLNVV